MSIIGAITFGDKRSSMVSTEELLIHQHCLLVISSIPTVSIGNYLFVVYICYFDCLYSHTISLRSPDRIIWTIDGKEIRTETRKQANGAYPTGAA